MKMQFCPYCGTKLDEGARFCKNCGESVINKTSSKETSESEPVDEAPETKRKTVYDGEIHKCPNCGEVLKSFEINCPACGHELRGTKASSAVKEFALKLEAIESRREYEKPSGFFAAAEAQQRVSKTDEQKISLIRSFPIPNSKEDMLEFMILATSSINMRTYDSSNTNISKSEKEINSAWFSKVQQVYEKAKRSYSTDSIFTDIKKLYDDCNEKIKKSKINGIIKWILMIGWIPLLLIFAIVYGCLSDPKEEAKELERLESIVVEVQEALDNEEYKHALRIADSIDYQRYDVEMERNWDIQRECWIDKVIEEAAEKGIDLEYTPTPDIDKANDEPSEDDSNVGFVEGFINGIEAGFDEIQGSINAFTAIKDEEKANLQQSTAVTEESTLKNKSDYSINSIEKGAVYTYGHDKWGLYCATAISDSIIQIERWGKHLSSEIEFNIEYIVGAFRITEAQYEFNWIDENHTAFSFTLTDKRDVDFKKSKNIVFTILGKDSDTDKGTNYSVEGTCYSYQNDDWHLYRAIQLTDEVIKIECWYRPIAIGKFHYGYDICVIVLNNPNYDFEWTDDNHTSFTISIQDEENSDLNKSTLLVFTQD